VASDWASSALIHSGTYRGRKQTWSYILVKKFLGQKEMSLQIRVCIAIQKQFEKQDEQEIITEEITKGIKIEDIDTDISTDSSNECSVTNIQEVLLAVDLLEHT
jgi:hypothetical protein